MFLPFKIIFFPRTFFPPAAAPFRCRRATEFQAAHEAAIEVKREAGVELEEGGEDDDNGEVRRIRDSVAEP